MPISAFFEENITTSNNEIRSLQKRLNGMALLRLILFAGFVWSIYSLAHQPSAFPIFAAIFLTGAYIVCLNIYFRWRDHRNLLLQLRYVNENELGILAGKPNLWPDGAAWLNNDSYFDDLDIFGPQSLFHLLNRTTTTGGARVLADRLRQPFLRGEVIREHQTAIRALSKQPDKCQLLIATGLVSATGSVSKSAGELDPATLGVWLETPPRLSNRIWLRVLLILLSCFNVYGLYRLFDDGNYGFIIAGIIISRLITGAFAGYVSQQHGLISHRHELLNQFAGVLKVFNTIDTGDSAFLSDLKHRTSMAHASLRRLSRLSAFFDQRLNKVVNLVLNTLFFYDLQCMVALERWKAANRSDFPAWVMSVGDVEALCSLATFAFNNPEYAYPVPADHDPHAAAGHAPALFIEATGLAHPLIGAKGRIANDLTFGRTERLVLVTGSNMSGKTTFLRTLGVNLLLAQGGLPVCAVSFTFVPMQLLTSLRINDSLQEQTSYFMAELKRLQRIIHRLQTGAPALVLIDEILRGTNSEDKTYGSAQFIHKLLDLPCISLFATHDLTLGRLEQEMPGRISNYCFESVIKDGQLYFDYRLQRGIARNRNASFLMEKMGII